MSLGLNHAVYGPDIKLNYANALSTHNPKNFGSNQSIVSGFTGPLTSQKAAASSAPGVVPQIVCGPLNQKGGTRISSVHGSNSFGMALNPETYEQQVPYSSMYAPIVRRGLDIGHRDSGLGAGKTLLPGHLNNYEPPKLIGGSNRSPLPIPTGSKYFTTNIENGMDYSIYVGSGYPPIKGNLSHGDCSRKIKGGRKNKKSKKKYRKGGGTLSFEKKLQGAHQTGGFIQDAPIGKCNSQLNNASWLNNKYMGGNTVTINDASKRTACKKFFRYANQQNGGKKTKKYKKLKSKKNRKNKKKTKRYQKGGILGGLSGNPLWKQPYQLSYPPNEINPWPPVRNITPF